MLTRRWSLVLAAAAGVTALVGVLASDRPAAADYDTDCANPTQVYTAANMPTNLNLTSTDVVEFQSGTFTGSVNAGGATICVAGPAAFNPSSINGLVRLFVRGTALMPPLAAESGAVLDNEGSVRFLPQVNVNGLATVINRAGATILVDAPGLSLPQSATVTNDGTITVDGSVNLNGTSVTNNATLTIAGTLIMSGPLTNNAQMTVGGVLTVDGSGLLVNTCSLTANGLTANDDVDNRGVIDLGSSPLLINGASNYAQTETAITRGGNFTNNGTVTGTGQYLFGGTTVNQGSVTGTSAASPIVFFDTTQSSGQIFDTNTGTVTNVVRQEVSPPDPGSCTVGPPPTTTTTSTTTTTTTTTTSTTTTTTSTTTTSTTTTSTLPASSTSTTTTTTYQGSLPTTGGRPVGNSLAAAIACTMGGLALTLVARTRRR
jgi:hypothetical protein